ncbi:alpha/beta-hydrolase [Thozetella sp. PMI_491]|nr:alpha/beta-hydrolase [Thozetella sp. PMI_491]
MSLPPDAHVRKVFYAGGEYVADEKGKRSLIGQIYVEHLMPVAPGKPLQEDPIVFIHGGGRTGVDFLTKPNGEPGWASFFLSRGFEVYIIDQAFRGRSPWHPSAGHTYVVPAELAENIWTRPGSIVPPPWPNATLHTQWPGPGTPGDPVFDAMFASMSPTLQDFAKQEGTSAKSCAALLDRIGKPVILIGHSFGATVEWLVADVRPPLVKAIIAVEPTGPPFTGMGAAGPRAIPTSYGLTYAPLAYEPPVEDPQKDLARTTVPAPAEGCIDVILQSDDPPPRKLINLVDIPVVVLSGEASKHARYDWGVAAFLKQAGVKEVEHILLADKGIRGNGHMLLSEDNSDEIAELMVDWIAKL